MCEWSLKTFVGCITQIPKSVDPDHALVGNMDVSHNENVDGGSGVFEVLKQYLQLRLQIYTGQNC